VPSGRGALAVLGCEMGLAHGSAGWVWSLLRGNLVLMPVILAVRGAMSGAGTKPRPRRLRIPGRPGGPAAWQVVWWESDDEEPPACVGSRASAYTGAGMVGLSASVSAASASAVKKPLPSPAPATAIARREDHVAGAGMKSLVCWRRGLATLSVVAAVLPVFGQPIPSLARSQPPATATASVGPFNKVWTYALSQYAQASQSGNSLTQLSNGTIVVGGDDAYQPNYCSTPSHPFRGGAWLVAVTSGDGQNVWQKLYSTCASAAQSASVVSGTPDGGLILAGGDFDNPACGLGCGWFAKLSSQGSIFFGSMT
jgi:hypothetical protein